MRLGGLFTPALRSGLPRQLLGRLRHVGVFGTGRRTRSGACAFVAFIVFGDAVLRGKLGLAKGEVSHSPAVALQFEAILPMTSFGNGLGPNTVRMEAVLLTGYRTEKLTLNGRVGLAIQDEPLRAHEQRDFLVLSGSIAYKVSERFEAFVDGGGFYGDGVPGAHANAWENSFMLRSAP